MTPLLLAGCFGSSADLPKGWDGASSVAAITSLSPDVEAAKPHVALARTGGAVRVTAEGALSRAPMQELCAYRLDTAPIERLLLQPCEMDPAGVPAGSAVVRVDVTLRDLDGRQRLEVWQRNDNFGQSPGSENPPRLVGGAAIPSAS